MTLAPSSAPAAEPVITGSEYIASFLAAIGCERVFTLTGGACAFMIDAVQRHGQLDVVCMQHEQSAAMAADAVWRVSRRLGVTMATSGPGATNLITGIACSFFDSIPSLHITGQVNQKESTAVHGAKVRQSGFQETKIVEMVRPVTKYAVMVKTVEELKLELAKSCAIAMSGRPGPVLIDVPMDVQQAMMPAELLLPEAAPGADEIKGHDDPSDVARKLKAFLAGAKRPVVLWGGGVGIGGAEAYLADWLAQTKTPFVASWAGLSGFDHDHPGFVGQIGVYGNRGANFVLQNADAVLVLGSRLDNRQRSGNADRFAVGAKLHVVDVDTEELRKYGVGAYETSCIDLKHLPEVLSMISPPPPTAAWLDYVAEMKELYYGGETSQSALLLNTLSPYEVVRRINACIDRNAIVIGDTGAAVCWLFQSFQVTGHTLFTAGGNSPMGYALPAAIGAKMAEPGKQVISYNGDGGFQLNLQELQTIVFNKLDIPIVIMNNSSYGIIKQFQDSYLDGRYTASLDGYSSPDFGKIATAYGLKYIKVTALDQIEEAIFAQGSIIIDVILSEDTLIEPKLEMGRPINDQYPYLADKAYANGNRFVNYGRPSPSDVLDEDG